jgi:hypothetical protein
MPVARGEDAWAISFKTRRSGSTSSTSPEGPENFLGEFFLPKTSSLLRTRAVRRTRRR